MNEERYEKLNSLRDQMDSLPLADYVDLVRRTANKRYKAMKRTTTRASYFYEISALCLRLARLIRG